MKLCIIIPAHNEEQHLRDCLNSFVQQTRPPDQLILVDDNATDSTFAIATAFAQNHPWIKVVQHQSSAQHLPGAKVIQAFNFGMQQATEDYDLIGKFDADIILPPNYFETILLAFKNNKQLGMCSGLLFVKNKDDWHFENIAKKEHIRGPIKLYHKNCFLKIGGLRPGVGWDTLDVLLSQYYGFKTKTLHQLQVKHQRPTGHGYSTKNYRQKGEALYKMRYGLPLAKLALLKMSWQAKNPAIYLQGIWGYTLALLQKSPRFVDQNEGKFIRSLRWKGIFGSLI